MQTKHKIVPTVEYTQKNLFCKKSRGNTYKKLAGVFSLALLWFALVRGGRDSIELLKHSDKGLR